MTFLLVLVIKISLLLAVILAAAACAWRASASVRHAVLAAGVVGALLIPLAAAVVPSWELPEDVLPPAPVMTTVSAVPVPSPLPGRAQPIALTTRATAWTERGARVWLAGSLLVLAYLGLGLSRLRVIASTAHPAGEDLQQLTARLAAQMITRRRVTVLISPRIRTPMTWGASHARILLPEDVTAWDDSRRRIVLAHELAHIARGDWSLHLLGELMCAVYWFNPLAWVTARWRQQESERACDDRVLALGINSVDYATQLVDLARDAQQTPWLPAPAIVRTSSLERRIRAMLNPQVNRSVVSRRGQVLVTAAALVLIVLLAAVSAAQTLASFGGSIVDPQNAVLPGVRLVMTNTGTGARIEVRSDRNGRFEFPPLEPGVYGVEVELPGFSSLTSTIRLEAGQRMEPNLQMSVGSLEETVTVTDPGRDVIETPRLQEIRPRPTPKCEAMAVSTVRPEPGRVRFDTNRIGGNIRPPVRIRNVSPVYPVNFRGSGQTQMVELTGVIGLDGRIEELRTIGSPLPDFEAAAVDAVREWAWDQTLLNCEPVRVNIQIHVYFAPGRP